MNVNDYGRIAPQAEVGEEDDAPLEGGVTVEDGAIANFANDVLGGGAAIANNVAAAPQAALIDRAELTR